MLTGAHTFGEMWKSAKSDEMMLPLDAPAEDVAP